MFSNTAITVENDAKIMNTKNRVPITRPPGIVLKMLDSVVNRNVAPTLEASAVTPLLNAKQAGKMMRPDISATNVSRPVIVNASPSRLRSRSM